jgi:SUMO ligase MMS21 Smc5/6 complex component
MPAADEMDAAYSGDNNNNDNDDDGMEEDDVQVAFERESFICPLSQSELVNPVTSSVCKHTFSRDPINQYLRQQNHNPVCPVPGCNRRLQTADLKPNKAIERRVARLQFTQINADDQDDYVVVSK